MRSAPKKYLVETEDKLNDKALSEGLSEKQEEEAKEILDNNEELAEEYYGSEPENRMKNRDWGVGTLKNRDWGVGTL